MSDGSRRAFSKGMNFCLIVLAVQLIIILAQVLTSVVASVRERGEDTRFAGSKIAFRS